MGAVGAGLVDFGISLGLLLVMMICYGVAPGWTALVLPLIVTLLFIAALGIGTLLSALTVAYRDFRHVVPFMVQLWMFATPAIYLNDAGVIGRRWQWLMAFNPANGLIVNFRYAAFGDALDWYALGISAAMSLVLILAGGIYFRKIERSFADVI
jgi:lipopolysaccharide transport system permease protein